MQSQATAMSLCGAGHLASADQIRQLQWCPEIQSNIVVLSPHMHPVTASAMWGLLPHWAVSVSHGTRAVWGATAYMLCKNWGELLLWIVPHRVWTSEEHYYSRKDFCLCHTELHCSCEPVSLVVALQQEILFQPLHTCTLVCAGLIPDIVDAFPEVEVCGSKVAMMYLKGLTNREMKTKVMKGGDVLDLGQGG